jgi:hypothetical protein
MSRPNAVLLAVLFAIPAALAEAPAALAADGASGPIRICRAPGGGDPHGGNPILIPAGAAFGDTGLANGAAGGGSYWPLWIVTTEPMRIEAGSACGTTRARITGNMDRHRVLLSDRRLFVPAAVATGGLKGWPSSVPLSATVTGDFK